MARDVECDGVLALLEAFRLWCGGGVQLPAEASTPLSLLPHSNILLMEAHEVAQQPLTVLLDQAKGEHGRRGVHASKPPLARTCIALGLDSYDRQGELVYPRAYVRYCC
jgi:hypothetical protein